MTTAANPNTTTAALSPVVPRGGRKSAAGTPRIGTSGSRRRTPAPPSLQAILATHAPDWSAIVPVRLDVLEGLPAALDHLATESHRIGVQLDATVAAAKASVDAVPEATREYIVAKRHKRPDKIVAHVAAAAAHSRVAHGPLAIARVLASQRRALATQAAALIDAAIARVDADLESAGVTKAALDALLASSRETVNAGVAERSLREYAREQRVLGNGQVAKGGAAAAHTPGRTKDRKRRREPEEVDQLDSNATGSAAATGKVQAHRQPRRGEASSPPALPIHPAPAPAHGSAGTSKHADPDLETAVLLARSVASLSDGDGNGDDDDDGMAVDAKSEGGEDDAMTGIEPSSGAQDAGDDEEEEDEDEDDTPYCFCRQPSLGDMIACDNKGCRYEWFHVKCLKMKRAPSGTWYCQDCSKLRRRERDRQRRRRR